jgi:hypothetical protein
VYSTSGLCWVLNGKLNRIDDGPTMITYKGDQTYTDTNGKPHRLTGPACIHSNGTLEYYVEGNQYTKEEYEKAGE